MADSKITALASIGTGTDPANDPLVIVDVSDVSPGGMSATGTTKKVTLNNLLACSPTATLASATISGQLRVGTTSVPSGSAVKIAANGAAGSDSYLQCSNGSGGGMSIGSSGGAGLNLYTFTGVVGAETNTTKRLTVDSNGVFTFENVGGVSGTAMTLNSSGLFLGISSQAFAEKFRVYGSYTLMDDGAFTGFLGKASSLGVSGATTDFGIRSANALIFLSGGATERMRIDSSGNVGIGGVTPSAWGSNWKSFDIQGGGRVYSLTSTGTHGFSFNAFNNNTNWLYQFSTGASRFELQQSGNFAWFTAPSGTAGNAITFTQAMTLDASGNLLVGKTVSLFSTVGVEASQAGFLSLTNSASTNAATNLSVYSTGAAAFRFYVGLAGTVFATNTTISAISDARLKENVQDIDVGLGAILALKPRKFDWKAGKGKDIKGDRGFIAQEFETVFPNLIDEWKDEAPEGEAPYKSVRQDLIPVLVKAIQELTARVQTLETR